MLDVAQDLLPTRQYPVIPPLSCDVGDTEAPGQVLGQGRVHVHCRTAAVRRCGGWGSLRDHHLNIWREILGLLLAARVLLPHCGVTVEPGLSPHGVAVLLFGLQLCGATWMRGCEWVAQGEVEGDTVSHCV